MSDLAVRVEALSKLYWIGPQDHYRTLRDGLADAMRAAFRRLASPFGDGRSAVRGQLSDNYIWALKDVSFELKQGEVLGVIGRNGAGKTTLLKILSRITKPTEGCAEISGRVGSLLEVGTGFHPELSGRENIYLNGAILGMKKAEIDRKFDEIVTFAEVEKFIDTPVKHYSSGMCVRLAFSVAAHIQPEVLLVDEVLAVGDIEFQRKCMGRMEKSAKEGKTVVVVSHSMSSVKGLCTKAILLEQGVMRAIGPVDAVVAEYMSANLDEVEKVISDQEHDIAGGSRIRVKRIRLLNRAMNSFSVFWQQPILVSLDIEVFKHIEDVSFGASMRMPDGTYVFVVYNDDRGQPKWTLESGEYTVEIKLQNILKPGLYTLNVGAYQRYPSVKNLFAVDAVNIEILGFAEQGLVPSSADPGLVRGVESVFSCRKLTVNGTTK